MALQALYTERISGQGWEEALAETVVRRKSSDEAVEYARRLATEVASHCGELDRMIEERLENWRFDRVSVVDLTILRIALAELLYCPETPTNVIINEAIEIAHRYSSNDAGRFVNGILDRLAREVRGA